MAEVAAAPVSSDAARRACQTLVKKAQVTEERERERERVGEGERKIGLPGSQRDRERGGRRRENGGETEREEWSGKE